MSPRTAELVRPEDALADLKGSLPPQLARDAAKLHWSMFDIPLLGGRPGSAISPLAIAGGSPAAPASLQHGDPRFGTVDRDPQHSIKPHGGPFARHSGHARFQIFDLAAQPFNQLITQMVKPVPGYGRWIDLFVKATGGVQGGATVAKAADAPWNVVQNLNLRDPFGELIYQGNGYEMLYLIPRYSGQWGADLANDLTNLPSYSDVAATGNFQFHTVIPLELLSDGYGSLPMMNASSQAQLTMQLAGSASVYTTAPATTLPVMEVASDLNFWRVPIEDPELAPADVGSSVQWQQAVSANQIGSGATVYAELPRKGTYIHTLILVLRDSTGARIDAWPDPITLRIDGVPIFIDRLTHRYDEMYNKFQVSRPTGVLVYSFRDSVEQTVSKADTGDLWLKTTPGSELEVGGTWGSISNAPATLTVLAGEVFPHSGIPYSHLAS